MSVSRTGRNVTTGSFPNPYEKLLADAKFTGSPLQVATGVLRDGQVVVGPDATPTVITARRGRGQITVLTFAPELEPFKSWKQAPYFWAKLTDVPPEFLNEANPNTGFNTYSSGRSVDGIFGAMIDSDQIRKLPVGWLLLLLLGYLPEVIQNHFGDGARWGVSIEYAVSEVDDETGRRLKRAAPRIDPVSLLLYCDNYWPMPFASMWQSFCAKDADAPSRPSLPKLL